MVLERSPNLYFLWIFPQKTSDRDQVRRRLRFKQGYDPKQELMAESSLGSLYLGEAGGVEKPMVTMTFLYLLHHFHPKNFDETSGSSVSYGSVETRDWDWISDWMVSGKWWISQFNGTGRFVNTATPQKLVISAEKPAHLMVLIVDGMIDGVVTKNRWLRTL